MANIVIKGKAYYAWTNIPQPDDEYTPKYCVSLVPEDDKQLARIEAMGVTVKTPGENSSIPGKYVLCTRGIKNKDGVPQNGPVVVDADKNATSVRIGDGSTVNLSVFFNPDNPKMKNFQLTAVQVVDLVEVEGGASGADAFSAVDGFKADEPVSDTSGSDEVEEDECPFDEDDDEGLL